MMHFVEAVRQVDKEDCGDCGDNLQVIGREEVEDPEDIEEMLEKMRDEYSRVVKMNGGSVKFMRIKIEKEELDEISRDDFDFEENLEDE